MSKIISSKLRSSSWRWIKACKSSFRNRPNAQVHMTGGGLPPICRVLCSSLQGRAQSLLKLTHSSNSSLGTKRVATICARHKSTSSRHFVSWMNEAFFAIPFTILVYIAQSRTSARSSSSACLISEAVACFAIRLMGMGMLLERAEAILPWDFCFGNTLLVQGETAAYEKLPWAHRRSLEGALLGSGRPRLCRGMRQESIFMVKQIELFVRSQKSVSFPKP